MSDADIARDRATIASVDLPWRDMDSTREYLGFVDAARTRWSVALDEVERLRDEILRLRAALRRIATQAVGTPSTAPFPEAAQFAQEALDAARGKETT